MPECSSIALSELAYLNSSIGSFLNKKCDGLREHTQCSGQNASMAGGYTPKVVRSVHGCFRDGVRKHEANVLKRVRIANPTAICRRRAAHGG